MEDTRRRRSVSLSLHREFTGSRLERQILMRAFALVIPTDRSDPSDEEPNEAAQDQRFANPSRSQGGTRS